MELKLNMKLWTIIRNVELKLIANEDTPQRICCGEFIEIKGEDKVKTRDKM